MAALEFTSGERIMNQVFTTNANDGGAWQGPLQPQHFPGSSAFHAHSCSLFRLAL